MVSPAPGMLLVARPTLLDPHFMRAVVYLLEHHEGGSMGLVCNRPLPLPLGEVWNDCPAALAEDRCCGEGGPVERGKGLLVHGRRGVAGSMRLTENLWVGGDTTALAEAVSQHRSPAAGPRLFLGHAGWGPGQLVGELASGSWLVRRGHPSLLLDPDPADDLWQGLISAGEEPRQPGLN